MKILYFTFIYCFLSACGASTPDEKMSGNPFDVDINVPLSYAKVSPAHVEQHARQTMVDVTSLLSALKKDTLATFSNVFEVLDDVSNKINTARNNFFMLYWVSPDSLIRLKGLSSFQQLDSLTTDIRGDKAIYDKMLKFRSSKEYGKLKGHRKTLVDDMILSFELTGVKLDGDLFQTFKTLTQEINQLSSRFSDNMNSSQEVLTLDENGVKGLPEQFKTQYRQAPGRYEIPIINATNETVMSNAVEEATRKGYFMKFNNRASDKNLAILDSLVKKRHELAKLMGYTSYAAYSLVPRMAKTPGTVWEFINDLVELSKEKAIADMRLLETQKRADSNIRNKLPLYPWDLAFYKEQLVKKKYQLDNEALKAYFPMDQCLKGMFDIYQELLGLQFKKITNPSVWHEEVEMYEVYEGDKLRGRFYLDLYPRPNKETWFYGITLTGGKSTVKGYELPVAMLLGNFNRPAGSQPALISRNELKILFHEFGHIANTISYHGEFWSQSNSQDDFSEAMSQCFENWLWDYDILSSFAKHYKTGETLPKATFQKMLAARNVGSRLQTINMLRRCIYDMSLYDKYDAVAPTSTDSLWQGIDKQLGIMPFYAEGTHPQASWIHINTNPVYMYGYLWSEVYAQDIFTEFKKNGLLDQKTGIRYRELILANGTQRDIKKAVEEFLGRAPNNKAYIKSLESN